MAGLNLGLGARAQVATSPPPAPTTAAEAAYGPGYTPAGLPDTKAALYPNDPFGIALWTGVGALALLLFIRYSLPA